LSGEAEELKMTNTIRFANAFNLKILIITKRNSLNKLTNHNQMQKIHIKNT
jgi:hypothetical protein